jgi:hypothetical protein
MVAKTDRRQDDEDANPFDERGVLKDHRSYRVPMYAMDALSRDVAQHFARVTDATGDGGLGLHKPGLRISNTITRDRSIYDAYEVELQNSWKTGAGEGEFTGAHEGDVCTVRNLDFPDDFGSPVTCGCAMGSWSAPPTGPSRHERTQ